MKTAFAINWVCISCWVVLPSGEKEEISSVNTIAGKLWVGQMKTNAYNYNKMKIKQDLKLQHIVACWKTDRRTCNYKHIALLVSATPTRGNMCFEQWNGYTVLCVCLGSCQKGKTAETSVIKICINIEESTTAKRGVKENGQHKMLKQLSALAAVMKRHRYIGIEIHICLHHNATERIRIGPASLMP